jgi:carboxypeptidase PM20D1
LLNPQSITTTPPGLKALFVFVIMPMFSLAQLAEQPAIKYDRSVENFSKAIRIKTVSHRNAAMCDSFAFSEFRDLLEKNYPLIHQHFEKTTINQFSYIYKWQGTDQSLLPYIFLAHQDVVPVEDESLDQWSVDPFGGEVKDDHVWGRGAVDDKVALIALMESAENLLAENFQPQRTIYLCFGHDEEVSGHAGAAAIAEWFQKRNILAELVLDEGMEVIEKNFAGLKKPIALIGVGEKGHASFELTVTKTGGHSSMPGKETAIDILTKALERLHNNPPPAKLIEPVKEFFDRVKHVMPAAHRMAINNSWLFKKKMLKELSKNDGTNALIRTTTVTTMINSGMKDNVIPAVAKATINCRILQGEKIKDVEEHIRSTVNDVRVTLNCIGRCWEASKITSTNSPAFKKIESLIPRYFPDAVVAPLIVIGATDSRYFRSISNGVINFSPVVDSNGQHGIDEKMSISNFKRMIEFYSELMKDKNEQIKDNR